MMCTLKLPGAHPRMIRLQDDRPKFSFTVPSVNNASQHGDINGRFCHRTVATGQLSANDTGVRWVPAKCVHPDLRQQNRNAANRQPLNDDQDDNQEDDQDSGQDDDHPSDGPSTSRD